ncbi:DUF2239 family protein [Paraburkholderia sp. FT54]|uniref:DUF2239 family protein n=1 Tax=Paraburkholderia sp. FT54 TaxID=3074437 RepID=UPI0028772A46|nr:DUF2239 family protein [Paraburkholderia sp. FT54]WNC89587.1 DUF2239 family protein [Paraburkholderia sp. FT54]
MLSDRDGRGARSGRHGGAGHRSAELSLRYATANRRRSWSSTTSPVGRSGGASVALRKLVDAARAAGEDKNRELAAQEAVYRFMTALAGNLPRYEYATCALYADDPALFEETVAA